MLPPCSVWYDRHASSSPPNSRAAHQDALNSTTRDELGVDVTLIDEMLTLDPIERLRMNDRSINAVMELRRAFANRQQSH